MDFPRFFERIMKLAVSSMEFFCMLPYLFKTAVYFNQMKKAKNLS